jgi:hypothetical protein
VSVYRNGVHQPRDAAPNILLIPGTTPKETIWRPIEGAKGWDAQSGPFMLKVDRHNGGSSHLVFGTEDLPPRGIHRSPQAPGR